MNCFPPSVQFALPTMFRICQQQFVISWSKDTHNLLFPKLWVHQQHCRFTIKFDVADGTGKRNKHTETQHMRLKAPPGTLGIESHSDINSTYFNATNRLAQRILAAWHLHKFVARLFVEANIARDELQGGKPGWIRTVRVTRKSAFYLSRGELCCHRCCCRGMILKKEEYGVLGLGLVLKGKPVAHHVPQHASPSAKALSRRAGSRLAWVPPRQQNSPTFPTNAGHTLVATLINIPKCFTKIS